MTRGGRGRERAEKGTTMTTMRAEYDYVADVAYNTESARAGVMRDEDLRARLDDMRRRARVSQETGYSSGWYDAVVEAIEDEIAYRAQIEDDTE